MRRASVLSVAWTLPLAAARKQRMGLDRAVRTVVIQTMSDHAPGVLYGETGVPCGIFVTLSGGGL